MSELAEQIRQLIDGSAPPVTIGEVEDKRAELRQSVKAEGSVRVGGSWHRTALRPLATAAAIIALVATGTFVVLDNGNGVHRSRSAQTHHQQSARWQLAAELSSSSYQLA